MRAVRNISPGEELVASYIDPVNMMEDRAKLLLARCWQGGSSNNLHVLVHDLVCSDNNDQHYPRYNFHCKCEVCTLPPDEAQKNDKVKRGWPGNLATTGVTERLLILGGQVRREILGLGNNLEDVFRDHPVKALR